MLSFNVVLQVIKDRIGNKNPLRLGYHWCRALLAAVHYGFPARKLTVIGVTGTDGKTTTVCMIAHALTKRGIRCGALSTSFFQIGDRTEWNETRKTSPSPFLVQRFLRDLTREGCTHAVLEYSSHGLVQHRTAFTWPRVAVITNTAQEHLDYHRSLAQYRHDKAKLFRMLQGKGAKVLNAKDGSFDVLKRIPSQHTYLFNSMNHEPSTINEFMVHSSWLTDIRVTTDGCAATLHSDRSIFDLRLPLPGTFNLANALAAIAATHAVGVPVADAVRALADVRGAPGRMERVDEGQPFSVFIDFTVTPQAYAAALSAATAMRDPGKRLLVLAGSCGDRMREKRPEIGRLCSKFADVAVFTFEETYAEDPEKILDDIWTGVDETQCELHRIMDRTEAIRFILSAAQPGDIVLICGMGAYPVMQTQQGAIPWDEQNVVRRALLHYMH